MARLAASADVDPAGEVVEIAPAVESRVGERGDLGPGGGEIRLETAVAHCLVRDPLEKRPR